MPTATTTPCASASSPATLARAYNDGLARGRLHQQRGGYPPPAFLSRGPADVEASYEAGWQLGFTLTTRVDLLVRR